MFLSRTTTTIEGPRDLARMEVALSAYYAAMMCTVMLPNVCLPIADEDRRHNLAQLVKKCKAAVNVCSKHRKSLKDAQAKNKKAKQKAAESAGSDPFGVAAEEPLADTITVESEASLLCN